MAIRVALNHTSLYRYDRPVYLSPHIFRLRPAAHCRTPIETYSLTILPEQHFIHWQQDPFGNYQARAVFLEPTRTLSVEVDLIATLTVINPFDFFLDAAADSYPFRYEERLRKALVPFLEQTENGPLLKNWVSKVSLTPRKTIDFLVEMNLRLAETIKYTRRLEPGVQSCEETLAEGIGSCRDTGWLLVQILRHLGLAARFVSGYLVQLVPDQVSETGAPGPTEDFTDLHAWCEVYVPGAGWIGLDPTSGLFAGEGHIPLVCVPDPESAAPVTGYTGHCETEFSHSNTLQRLHEHPRVTKPYNASHWTDIDALGKQVDTEIAAHDIRLTMQNRPTFVVRQESETERLNRRERAAALLRELQTQFAPGGVRYYGHGTVERPDGATDWQFGCVWRRDGAPLWRNAALLADPWTTEGGVTAQDVERFGHHLTPTLGLSTELLRPAYEQTLSTSSEGEHTGRPAGATEMTATPIGYVLPLRWDAANGRWEPPTTGGARGRILLTPGDSPISLRLPAGQGSRAVHIDNRDNRDLLTSGTPQLQEPNLNVQTVLCVEHRDSRLHVFMPSLPDFAPYRQLLDAVAQTAETLRLPVVLDGAAPPTDPSLHALTVAPESGVLKLTLPPAESWDALHSRTTALYAAAHRAGLHAEKFMTDGRHTGTGGGNRIVIGGPTPEESPLLRRPDLLRSLITYWQHHPSLSYLFSGTTGRSCRVDEQGLGHLYELKLAFQQIPIMPPVIANDRADDGVDTDLLSALDTALSAVLGDSTARTDRAEFGLDRLYPAGTPHRRLGLLEFRVFEMPPHPQMNAVQMLLVRTLIARFWQTPYTGRPVRWGTALHDRFMLPHHLRADMRAVVDELRAAGYRFEMAWLDPFFEFRFPVLGRVTVRDMEVVLRVALEPSQHVSGTATGTGAESAMERIQVRVFGLTESRYVVTCNGHRLPLHPTDTQGEYVGAVRYRARRLYPTPARHAPLIFDVFDTWNGRSIGGCTYHVSEPSGPQHEVRPVNAYAAEARRVSRFEPNRHTPGTGQHTAPPPEAVDPDYPYTLDLRRRVPRSEQARVDDSAER